MNNPGDTWIGKNISFLLEHHKCDPDLQCSFWPYNSPPPLSQVLRI